MATKWIEGERKFSVIWFCLTSATRNKSFCVEFLNIFYKLHLFHSSSYFRSEIICMFRSSYECTNPIKHCLDCIVFDIFLNIFVRQLNSKLKKNKIPNFLFSLHICMFSLRMKLNRFRNFLRRVDILLSNSSNVNFADNLHWPNLMK